MSSRTLVVTVWLVAYLDLHSSHLNAEFTMSGCIEGVRIQKLLAEQNSFLFAAWSLLSCCDLSFHYLAAEKLISFFLTDDHFYWWHVLLRPSCFRSTAGQAINSICCVCFGIFVLLVGGRKVISDDELKRPSYPKSNCRKEDLLNRNALCVWCKPVLCGVLQLFRRVASSLPGMDQAEQKPRDSIFWCFITHVLPCFVSLSALSHH